VLRRKISAPEENGFDFYQDEGYLIDLPTSGSGRARAPAVGNGEFSELHIATCISQILWYSISQKSGNIDGHTHNLCIISNF
jgi:hypothetical protein